MRDREVRYTLWIARFRNRSEAFPFPRDISESYSENDLVLSSLKRNTTISVCSKTGEKQWKVITEPAQNTRGPGN